MKTIMIGLPRDDGYSDLERQLRARLREHDYQDLAEVREDDSGNWYCYYIDYNEPNSRWAAWFVLNNPGVMSSVEEKADDYWQQVQAVIDGVS